VYKAEPPPATPQAYISTFHPKLAEIIEKHLPPPHHKSGRSRAGGALGQSEDGRGAAGEPKQECGAGNKYLKDAEKSN
jgi:hypothetical protein